MKKLLVVLVVLALAGTAQANMLAGANVDFEGGWADHWGVPSPPGAPVNWGSWDPAGEAGYLADTAGVTGRGLELGVHADLPAGGFAFVWNDTQPAVSEGMTLTLYADIIDLTPGGAVADFAALNVGGYEAKIAGVTSSWATYSIDFVVPAGMTVVEVKLAVSTDSPLYENVGCAYGFDNVVLTPEPITIALLGLGGLFLRRRK